MNFGAREVAQQAFVIRISADSTPLECKHLCITNGYLCRIEMYYSVIHYGMIL